VNTAEEHAQYDGDQDIALASLKLLLRTQFWGKFFIDKIATTKAWLPTLTNLSVDELAIVFPSFFYPCVRISTFVGPDTMLGETKY
jgi:hypothetical protein